jgi:hypothetical protein
VYTPAAPYAASAGDDRSVGLIFLNREKNAGCWQLSLACELENRRTERRIGNQTMADTSLIGGQYGKQYT